MPERYVLAVDQGTSATKCLLLSSAGAVVRTASAPVPIRYPRPGWVEQDAGEILASVISAAARCLDGESVSAVGLSTQRESAVVWDRRSGEPVGPVLGWQDQRARGVCEALRDSAALVRTLSGLPLDPMFSAAKLRWLLDRTPSALVGTVDAWLLYALTGAHRIEVGTASRTQLLDVSTGVWSPELAELFGIPSSALPSVVPSGGSLGVVGPGGGVLSGLPIVAVMGDSHAALYAHGARAAGTVKVTYGTGSSVMSLVHAGSSDLEDFAGVPVSLTTPTPHWVGPSKAPTPDNSATLSTIAGTDTRVCRTIAWADPGIRHANEGNIRSSGSTITWLGDLLGVSADQVASLAADSDSDGVSIVPAFGGLAAPWWDDAATGTITGLTLGTRAPQLARAALESIAHQVADVVEAMGRPGCILADGGAAANDQLMRIQARLAGVPVKRARTANLSALGVAFLAGRQAGFWDEAAPIEYDDFQPDGDPAPQREAWRDAVHRALSKKEMS
jgi:glycerol kinase